MGSGRVVSSSVFVGGGGSRARAVDGGCCRSWTSRVEARWRQHNFYNQLVTPSSEVTQATIYTAFVRNFCCSYA